VLADGLVDQSGACRFFTCVPLDETGLFVEEVRYGPSAELDPAAAGQRIEDYVALRGWKGGKVEAEESEALPVPLGGDFQASWRIGGARVAKLGLRGGFFHPTLGSPLGEAARGGLLLAAQRDYRGAALHDAFEAEASAQWKRREPYRSFNRALLHGGCDALERLYNFDAALIGRFHGERLGLLDRRKLAAL
jgi:lycopene beta-cyclase